uniref:TORTIFOLIA1/SINE1-2 N-terminal domain-containing protein n=1 Tax=Rhizophora mucronata TaxID=61149 RepID=A0A2P2IR06_RHIMU
MSFQKRSSPTPPLTAGANDLKHRVMCCLNKLSDRDTLSLAAAELESIAKNLSRESFSSFLNCIQSADSSSKSPVRKQSVNLLTLLSHSHGNSLASYLSKMVSTVSRRLHDNDSAVRSACVEAAAAMSSKITDPPFSTVWRPLFELLVLEQDSNAQIGAAMCLAAAIEAAPEPEAEQLRKLLPRLGKLAKAEGFKAKAAVLNVIRSIVGVGGASGKSVLEWLVPCLAELWSCEDWATRKAAAEALGKVAVVEKELAKEHKAACLNSLESRRFDKVKVVRETMNRVLQLWKEVPGVSEDVLAPSQSRSSSIGPDNAIGASSSSVSTSSHDVNFKTSAPRKPVPTNKSPLSDASFVNIVRKQSSANCNEKNSKVANFYELDHRKPSSWKIEVAIPQEMASGDDVSWQDSGLQESRENGTNENHRPETKCDDKLHKFGGLRSGSKVVPFYGDDDDNCYSKDIEVSNPAEEFYENKEIEDLSLIRKQLVQIEDQQSCLLSILQV